MNGFKKLAAVFYRSSSGREPVRAWLKDLDLADRKIVGDDIRDCEFAWPVGLPLCRPITGRRGLWEIRSNLSGGRIAACCSASSTGRWLLLHGFIEKTQRTPGREIEIAVKRMKGGA
jgi:phage-related protein